MIEMLQSAFFATAEDCCNRLIKRDPITAAKLSALSGKVIALYCNVPQLSLYVLPNAEGIYLQSQFDGKPDVSLEGSLSDFIKLLSSQDKAALMFGNSVQISGDSQLATEFQQIIVEAEIDWEDMLASSIGELPAHQAVLFARWKASWYKNTASSLLANLPEYIQEEARLLPTRPEAERFYQEVSALHEQADRLAAKIAAYRRSLNAEK